MNKNFEKAVLDYQSGLTIKESGVLNNIPKTTLQRHLQKLGIIRRYTPRIKIKDNLKGLKIENWTVIMPLIEKDGKCNWNRVMWLCECDCGNQSKIRQTWLLVERIKKCKYCFNMSSNNCNWSGCGQLSGTCWKRIKNNAKRKSRSLPFLIEIDYAWELYEKQNGKCALTGLDIPFPNKVEDGDFPSLDRIDSNMGYIKGNVQWVHKHINVMKWNHEQEYFKQLCKLVVEHKEG